MSISSKHIHVSIALVYHGWMPISRSRLISKNNAEFWLWVSTGCSKASLPPRHWMVQTGMTHLLPLPHHVVVLVKAFISILDDEGIHHWNGSGGTQTFFLLKFASFDRCFFLSWRLNWGDLLSMRCVHCQLFWIWRFSIWWLRPIHPSIVMRNSKTIIVVGGLFAYIIVNFKVGILLCSQIKHYHIIQFLCNFN
jgi:hypothetical protein